MIKNYIKFLVIPAIILWGGGAALNNCYGMEDLTVEQQIEQKDKERIAKALNFTNNDLLSIIKKWDLR